MPHASVDDWRREVSRLPVGEAYEVTVQQGSSAVVLAVTSARPPALPRDIRPTPSPTDLHDVWIAPNAHTT